MCINVKKAALDKLTKNATEIAVFVSSANPNLPKDKAPSLTLPDEGFPTVSPNGGREMLGW